MNQYPSPTYFEISGKKYFNRYLDEYKQDNLRALQIGVFTGDASIWLMENTNFTLDDVDTWLGSPEMEFDFEEVEQYYDQRIENYKDRITKYKMTSDDFFKQNKNNYDFVYIDGDHTALQTFYDAVNAFKCLSVGGIIAFDDYRLDWHKGIYYEPYRGINSFCRIFEEYTDDIEIGYQRWVMKTGNPE